MNKVFSIFILTGVLALQSVNSVQLCGKYDVLSINGKEYVAQNNIWGASTSQCIDVNGTAFTVTQSSHNQNSVAAYPSVYKGCHWGDCTNNSGMPILVSNLINATISWSVTTITSGVWNAACEAWFSSSTNTSNGYNGGAELMVWIDYKGMQPAGSQVGTVSIAGSNWEVWYSNIGWNYIAYRRIGAASSLNVDFKLFVDDSVNRGYIQRSWYMHAMEAGFELMSGGQGLTQTGFSFAINTIPRTPTPPPYTNPPYTVPPTTNPPQNKGDVNSDGQVNIIDALLVAQYSVGQNPAGFNPNVADTNNDGQIDIIDALRIAQYSVGIIQQL